MKWGYCDGTYSIIWDDTDGSYQLGVKEVYGYRRMNGVDKVEAKHLQKFVDKAMAEIRKKSKSAHSRNTAATINKN